MFFIAVLALVCLFQVFVNVLTVEVCYLLHDPGGTRYVLHMRGVFMLTVVLVLIYFCQGAVPCLSCLQGSSTKHVFVQGSFYFFSCILLFAVGVFVF